ncbi:MAG: isoprenylcysteine carboxylmethyltransferase family protein [Smithellaceae bacterium]
MKGQERLVRLIFGAATSDSRLKRLWAPLVAIAYTLFASAFAAGALQVDRCLGFPSFPSAPLNLFSGIPFIAAGVFLSGWCIVRFIRAKGTPVPLHPPPVLLTDGPYAHVRNPMISGVFLMISGAGLLLQSLSLTFFFAPLFMGLNILEIKMIEEPELTFRLGGEYLDYKKRTPMFFPKWSLRQKGKS